MLDDSDRIAMFYEESCNNYKYIARKTSEQIAQEIRDGYLLIAEHRGQLVAVSGASAYGAGRSIALRGQAVRCGYQGYRLQTVLIRLSVANVLLHDGPETVILAEVNRKNARSMRNASACGFKEVVPQVPADDSCSECSDRESAAPCCYATLTIEIDQARLQVAQLLDEASEQGTVTLLERSDPDDQLHVVLNLAIMHGTFRQALETVVRRNDDTNE